MIGLPTIPDLNNPGNVIWMVSNPAYPRFESTQTFNLPRIPSPGLGAISPKQRPYLSKCSRRMPKP
ncbi:hypothetical protein SCLCIDRAFT_1214537 [Scleroderma citrinum Foug A]|uniref:Uncharacterized protein n=1 Tax=Scleroderma citrinum Foug A TaxID=1036808 RepID=A0A0C3DQR9_9AGAM|nr:hypothetical protein SCLCIDRAFT_1214537 [Scleroderma citrinum Foug A]